MSTALTPTPDPTSDAPTALPWWRTALATTGGIVCAVGLLSEDPSGSFTIWAMAGVLMVSGLLHRIPRLSVQLITRALWWQMLVLGTIVALADAGSKDMSWILLGGSVMALLGAGRSRLDLQDARFAPVAFRTSLIASLILALADTQALLLYGVLCTEGCIAGGWSIDKLAPTAMLFGSAGVMSVALWGMFRLKLWGVALNIVANLTIAALALSGTLQLPEILAYGFAATAFLQLLVPVPMLRTLWHNLRTR